MERMSVVSPSVIGCSTENDRIENASVISSLMKCRICYEDFEQPKLLPCSHMFCESCIGRQLQLTKAVTRGRLLCPLCGVLLALPRHPTGVSSLRPGEPVLSNLKEVYSQLTHCCDEQVEADRDGSDGTESEGGGIRLGKEQRVSGESAAENKQQGSENSLLSGEEGSENVQLLDENRYQGSENIQETDENKQQGDESCSDNKQCVVFGGLGLKENDIIAGVHSLQMDVSKDDQDDQDSKVYAHGGQVEDNKGVLNAGKYILQSCDDNSEDMNDRIQPCCNSDRRLNTDKELVIGEKIRFDDNFHEHRITNDTEKHNHFKGKSCCLENDGHLNCHVHVDNVDVSDKSSLDDVIVSKVNVDSFKENPPPAKETNLECISTDKMKVGIDYDETNRLKISQDDTQTCKNEHCILTDTSIENRQQYMDKSQEHTHLEQDVSDVNDDTNCKLTYDVINPAINPSNISNNRIERGQKLTGNEKYESLYRSKSVTQKQRSRKRRTSKEYQSLFMRTSKRNSAHSKRNSHVNGAKVQFMKQLKPMLQEIKEGIKKLSRELLLAHEASDRANLRWRQQLRGVQRVLVRHPEIADSSQFEAQVTESASALEQLENHHTPLVDWIICHQNQLYKKLIKVKGVVDVIKQILQNTSTHMDEEQISRLLQHTKNVIQQPLSEEPQPKEYEDLLSKYGGPEYHVPKSGNVLTCLLRDTPDPRQLTCKLVKRIQGTGSSSSKFNCPMACSFAPNGDFMVADKNNFRLQVFDKHGTWKGELFKGMFRPTRISINPSNYTFYINEEHGTKIKVYSADGKPVKGLSNGALWSSNLFFHGFTSAGDVVMTDPNQHQVSIHERDTGDTLHAFSYNCTLHVNDENAPLPPPTTNPHTLAVSPDDIIMLAETKDNRVQVFSQQGDFLFCISGLQVPTAVCVDQYRNIFVAEGDTNRVSVYNRHCRLAKVLLTARDGLASPVSLAVSDGTLVVTQYSEHMPHGVLIFQLNYHVETVL